MICKQTLDLLLANRKTPKEFRRLVASSFYPTRAVEQAFLEVQYYADLEKVIEVGSRLNLSLIECAIGLVRGRDFQAPKAAEAAKKGAPAG